MHFIAESKLTYCWRDYRNCFFLLGFIDHVNGAALYEWQGRKREKWAQKGRTSVMHITGDILSESEPFFTEGVKNRKFSTDDGMNALCAVRSIFWIPDC